MNEEHRTIKEEQTDFKKLIFNVIRYWRFILVSLIIAMTIAYCYVKITLPIYEVNTTILIKKENSSFERINNVASGYDKTYDIQNEICILQSIQLLERTLGKLDFGISYYSRKTLGFSELYDSSPFRIHLDSSHYQAVEVPYEVYFISQTEYFLTLDAKSIALSNLLSKTVLEVPENKAIKIRGKINQPIKTKNFCFTLVPTNDSILKNYVNERLFFKIRTKESLLSENFNFKVAPYKSSSIISISAKGNNINKTIDFLNTLADVFLEKSVEKKLMISDNTIRFIESQLFEVSDSLKYSEDQLQGFQASNKLMNMDYQTQQVFSALDESQRRKAELLVQKKYLQYIQDFIKNSRDIKDFITPSAVNISDPTLNNLLNELLNLLSERMDMTLNIKKENPYLSSQDSKIENKKKIILENIKNILQANDLILNDLNKKIAETSDKAGKLPAAQGKLYNYQRIYKLNDAFYTFLLTKRSELQITRAAIVPDNEILDRANRRQVRLVLPIARSAYLFALFWGLGLPLLFIFLFNYFNDKIDSIETVESLTDIPILGCIVRAKEFQDISIIENPNSLIAESFRSVRANLQFIRPLNDKHVILVTSSVPNEGKSFISNHLAESLVMFNKRTVLVYFDLRKPLRNSIYNQYKSTIGLSNYLSGNCSLNDILLDTKEDNLKLILPGPIPPNANELIASERTEAMIIELKKQFDYIIIDTPPVGVVTDALLLLKLADIHLLITRHNFTRKQLFTRIIDIYRKKNVSNLAIIINDIPLNKNRYGYGYYYGYDYGYYGKAERKKTVLKGLLQKVKIRS